MSRIGETVWMSSPVTAHTTVAAAPPRIPVADVELAVEWQFGLGGRYFPLVSERDQNFRLKTPVPRVVPALDARHSGRIEYAGKSHVLRVVSYLAGEPLASVPVNAGMARDLGGKLAILDLGLDGFSHEGENPVLLWDLQRAAELRELLDRIDNPSIRGSVLRAIDDFDQRVYPELKSLHTQVIHGDANPENILIDPASTRVSGFIDFGDMVRAPLVFDVAIAASYLRTAKANALELIAPFVAGYHAVRLLSVAELALLFELVRVRLATTITLLYWRLDARDQDDPYRQKTLERESDAIAFLTALDDLGRAAFLRELQRAISG